MDPGFYQDLTGRPYGLLIVLEHRLNCDDTPVIYQFTGARHDAQAVEQIAGRRRTARSASRSGSTRHPRAGPGEPGVAGE